MAEIKVEIKKEGVVEFSATHDTMELADAWIASIEKSKGWGIPDAWVKESESTEDQRRFRGATRLIEGCVVSESEDCKEFFLKGDYDILKTDVTSIKLEEARVANVLAVGEKIIGLCNSLSKMVVGYNYTRSLTALQIEEMATTFAPVVTLVEGKRPFSAKPLIEAIVPDGTIITEQMKADLLNEYNKRGF